MLSKIQDFVNSKYIWLFSALIIAIFFNFAFWDNLVGLNLFLFALVYITVFLVATKLTKLYKEKLGLVFFGGAVLFSLLPLFYTSEFVIFFSVVLTFLFLFLGSAFVTLKDSRQHKFYFSAIRTFRLNLIGDGINNIFKVVSDIFSFRKIEKHNSSYRLIAGVIMSLPILFIFGALFFAADPVFADSIRNIFSFQINEELIQRIITTIIFTLIASSFFYILRDEKHRLNFIEKITGKSDSIVVTTILTLVNILFFLFLLIQFKYLFGNAEWMLSDGKTYAEFAREGFFQLVWVMIFAIALILLFYRYETHKMNKSLQFVSVLLLAQVMIVGVSALKRMNMYQDAYGFTVLRLYVEWFIYTVFISLLILSASILKRIEYRKVLYAGMIFAGIAVFIVLARDVDRIIAKENVDRYLLENKKIDTYYFTMLSANAWSEINRLTEPKIFFTMSEDDRSNIRAYFHKVELKKQQTNSFFEFNFRLKKPVQKPSVDLQ